MHWNNEEWGCSDRRGGRASYRHGQSGTVAPARHKVRAARLDQGPSSIDLAGAGRGALSRGALTQAMAMDPTHPSCLQRRRSIGCNPFRLVPPTCLKVALCVRVGNGWGHQETKVRQNMISILFACYHARNREAPALQLTGSYPG